MKANFSDLENLIKSNISKLIMNESDLDKALMPAVGGKIKDF